MFLTGSFLGYDSFITSKQPSPIPSTYSKISFFGNCIVSNIQIKNIILSDDQINNVNINNMNWGLDTLCLAEFKNNLDVGNIKNLSSPILKWIVNRKATDETIFKKLSEIDVDNTEFIDYTAQGNKTYIYDIFPKTSNEIGSPLESETISANLYSWSLTDIDTQTVYLFDLNLESNTIENVTDFQEIETHTKYNVFSIGSRDFLRGGIRAIVGDINVNGELVQPVEYLDDLRTFINNGKPKLLKSRKGRILNVMTYGYSESVVNDNISCQPNSITFQFAEVGEV